MSQRAGAVASPPQWKPGYVKQLHEDRLSLHGTTLWLALRHRHSSRLVGVRMGLLAVTRSLLVPGRGRCRVIFERSVC